MTSGGTKTKKYVDLHIHTFHSDSSLSPEEVVDMAHSSGFSAISITDHDCIDAIPLAIKHAEHRDIEVIPGVELTAEHEDSELHILGYFLDYKDDGFGRKLEAIRQARVKRIYEMVEKLKEFGVNIDPEKVFALSGRGSVGRLHLAIVLYNEGVTSSISEAFRKYIGNNAPCSAKKFKLTPAQAIDMILDLGGVPVLAHPYVLGRDDMIPELVLQGIRGIEVYHTEHPYNVTLHYEELAMDNGLIKTGGSDCHGIGKGNVLIGKIKVGYAVVDELRKESQKIRGDAGNR